VDATGCPGRAQAAPPGGVQWCPAATALLGIPGLVVTAVTRGEDGWTIVDVATCSGRILGRWFDLGLRRRHDRHTCVSRWLTGCW